MGTFVAAIVLTAGLAFVLGAAVGHWLAVALAGLAWPVLGFGLWIGAWGDGFSQDDEWWVPVVLFGIATMAAVVGAVLAVLARRMLRLSASCSPT